MKTSVGTGLCKDVKDWPKITISLVSITNTPAHENLQNVFLSLSINSFDYRLRILLNDTPDNKENGKLWIELRASLAWLFALEKMFSNAWISVRLLSGSYVNIHVASAVITLFRIRSTPPIRSERSRRISLILTRCVGFVSDIFRGNVITWVYLPPSPTECDSINPHVTCHRVEYSSRYNAERSYKFTVPVTLPVDHILPWKKLSI